MRIFAIILLALSISSCSVFSGVAIDTPLKRWAVAADSLTAVKVTAARLIEDGKVSVETADRISALVNLGDKAIADALTLIRTGADETSVDQVLIEAVGYIDAIKNIVSAFQSASVPVLILDNRSVLA